MMSTPIGSQKANFKQSFGPFFLAIALIMSFRWLFVEPFVIPSGSMIPSLLIYDHIVVNKFAYGVRWPFTLRWIVKRESPKAGEIVVFKSVEDPTIFMVKRVVGVPGDRISFLENGQIFINAKLIESVPLESDPTAGNRFYKLSEKDLENSNSYNYSLENLGALQHRILHKGSARYTLPQEIEVREGHFFVMGDNRDNSNDSRYWGLLPENRIIGRAFAVWLSCENTLEFARMICDPNTIRWPRLFSSLE